MPEKFEKRSGSKRGGTQQGRGGQNERGGQGRRDNKAPFGSQNARPKKKNTLKATDDITEVLDGAMDPTAEVADMAYGVHAVTEILKSGKVNKLFLQEDGKGQTFETLKTLAQEKNVPVKWVPKAKLDLMTDKATHQGVVAGISPYEYLTLTELMDQTKTETPFYVILDSLEDPHNFGSILRTADATGVDGIIIPKHRAVGVTSTVVKTSTGAVEYVPIARVTNLMQTVKTLKDAGFWIFGTDMEGTSYEKWQATGKIALIIGNEGHGVSASLKKEVDEMLTIPMTGHVQSLNASVAAALLMYGAFMQRRD